ncbi:MAG: aminotransferase class III-fold pyridoxal phosphate-dependent enzyme [Proteobacteria bacterium]|nr:aminotransferase class III-fold pyridoxal phosphate-dependent enzyme [Pseudomonadota bacterium]
MLKLSHNTLPNKGIKIVRAKNEIFWDDKGKEYIDLSSQTFNLLFGQCNSYINKYIFEQLKECSFIDQDFISEKHQLAIEALYNFIPSNLKCFNLRLNDGSSAVEAAVKQARRATGKSKVLTIDGIYLGQNSQVIHLRGWGKKPYDILRGSTEDVIYAPIPYPNKKTDFNYASEENGDSVCELIEKHHQDLACVLIDPVMISSGVTTGRDFKTYLSKITQACQYYKIPLIFDECQTFGWVPDGTVSKHYNLDIDMLVLAKGIGGGIPLAVCVSKPKFDNLNFGEADYTNGGTLPAIAGMMAVCHLMSQKNYINHFNRLSSFIQTKLKAFVEENTEIYSSRGIGLINALEIDIGESSEKNSILIKEIAKTALKNGVFVRSHSKCLSIKPSRIMTLKNAEKALDILFNTVRSFINKENN